ncbi:MAG: hypothetical protein KJN92_11600, partial [Gemmatimonadetes bacterium]|nr:hypothetical protein [Gemmatimonadota bacterium]
LLGVNLATGAADEWNAGENERYAGKDESPRAHLDGFEGHGQLLLGVIFRADRRVGGARR